MSDSTITNSATAEPALTHGIYDISADAGRIDAERVHHWLSTDAYWAMGRPREKQDRAIEGSLNFGAYHRETGEIAAYARVVTDYATFAWLCDVYVDRPARGTGLGTALVTAVRDHLAPYGLRRILLATADAHGVYEKVGFTPLQIPDKWMVLGQP
ncbi:MULTISPECIES: GNAT family N-acetyltransferase [unclassified Streptomyces]|uniref:GNAT family N-acetyltransferase n=1 Tax=unclassified Streptomyces TaxID=2593676 RepID=UPI0016606247|nr:MULTISPECIES: GNAT family N-acetyltransferase [unclassified Streptomyces]MBD0712286.1 GNAT family N-acetyltransferase [Streptomyces sp. CBMA291]MBD0714118.1 GNAT family N-acetyltransferase [Streptomyces sp. CBMA370]